MRNALRLFAVVGKASLIFTAGSLVLLAGAGVGGFVADKRAITEILVLVLAVLLPLAAAVGWMLRRMQREYATREARAMTIAFGLCAPLFYMLSMVLGEISGSYGEALGGQPIFGMISAFTGVIVLTAFFSFVVCLLVLLVTRRIVGLEQSGH